MTAKEKKEFKEQGKDITRILAYLENDEGTGKIGLVKQVDEMEASLRELLTREREYRARATTWGTVGGAIVGGLILLGKYIVTKFL